MTISGCPVVSSPHLVRILHQLPKCEYVHQKAIRLSYQERAIFLRPHRSFKNCVNYELETKNSTFPAVLVRHQQQERPPDIMKTMVGRVLLHSREPASNAIQPQPNRRCASNCKSWQLYNHFYNGANHSSPHLGSVHLFTCITGRPKLQSLSARLSKTARRIVAPLNTSFRQTLLVRPRCRSCRLYSRQRSRKSKIFFSRSRSTSSPEVPWLKGTSWVDLEILPSISKWWGVVSRIAIITSQMTMTSPLWPQPAQIIVDPVYKR